MANNILFKDGELHIKPDSLPVNPTKILFLDDTVLHNEQAFALDYSLSRQGGELYFTPNTDTEAPTMVFAIYGR